LLSLLCILVHRLPPRLSFVWWPSDVIHVTGLQSTDYHWS
jgi:hypothetical protein